MLGRGAGARPGGGGAAAFGRDATVQIDSMKFDDVPPAQVQIGLEDAPPPPPGYLDAVLEAVEAG